ncbi:MAG: class I SAM-dependent methyltransferase [Spirulina sp.]
MANFPTPPFLKQYLANLFNLKQDLQGFLQIDPKELDRKLEPSREQLAGLGHKDFDWETATNFYRDKVKDLYLCELGAWHLASHEYIGDTLRLIADRAKGRVLDFGGGIGTHTLGVALSPQVERVVYCDLNPIHLDFVRYRAEKMNLSHKISFSCEVSPEETFDTILAFDVIEHLLNPREQLLQFHKSLTHEGILIINWYFFRGFNHEFPFHIDEPEIVEAFFKTLQYHFLEVFQPYYITARCYTKWNRTQAIDEASRSDTNA